MIDLKLLRNQPQVVAEAIRNKGASVELELLLSLDKVHVELMKEVEQLRSERNRLSETIATGNRDLELIERSKTLKQELAGLEPSLKEANGRFLDLYRKVPNIPTDDTPIGLSEEENVIVKTWGEPTAFNYTPRNHFEVSEHRGWIDKERAAKVTGSRFAYLKGELVKLQFSLMTWVFDKLTDEAFLNEIIKDEKLSVSSKPFLPVLPPFLIRTSMYDDMDRLEPSDDRYKIEGEDLWLQGSAEHVLGSMHANEIIEESDLPLRYLGYATSFRKEAGAAGKDMEGIIRLHQFDKLEMESFAPKEVSHEEHLFLSAIQERLMQLLDLPYRKVQKCTFDIGKPNAKGSDIDTWLPGQNKYRETHTADYMTDYQARRLNTRVRRSNGPLEFLHTNDATAIACGRTMVAIIENYQNKDMTVRVPEQLQPYLGGQSSI